MRRPSLLLVSVFSLAALTTAFAKPFVVVTEERQGDTVSLYANLQNATVVSFEMTPTLTNFRSSARLPIVVELTKQKTFLTTLTKIKPTEKTGFKYNFRYAVGRANSKPDLAHVYQLPFKPGPEIKLRSGYGERAARDIAVNEYMLVWEMPEGTSVLAARDGTVVAIRDDSNEHGLSDEFRNKSNLVFVEHSDGTIGEYVRLKFQGVAVKLGQTVKTGDLLGYSGNTGLSRNPSLLVRIARVNPAARHESLAAIWDTKEDYRTRARSIEEGKGVERVSSSESVDSAK